MSNGGWIKVHRSLFDHWTSTDPVALWLWIRLLLQANYEDRSWVHMGELYQLKRGQCLISIADIAASAKPRLSYKPISLRLNMFEAEHMIVQERSRRGTIVTICNYERYQGDDVDEGRAEVTQKSCRGETEVAQRSAPKNYKKEKNDKNDKKNTHRSALPALPAELDQPTWDLWLQHRREKKSPVTPTSAAQIFKKYSGRPAEFIRDVQHSISNGWTGLFEAREVAPQSKIAPQSGSDIEAIAKRALGGIYDKP